MIYSHRNIVWSPLCRLGFPANGITISVSRLSTHARNGWSRCHVADGTTKKRKVQRRNLTPYGTLEWMSDTTVSYHLWPGFLFPGRTHNVADAFEGRVCNDPDLLMFFMQAALVSRDTSFCLAQTTRIC